MTDKHISKRLESAYKLLQLLQDLRVKNVASRKEEAWQRYMDHLANLVSKAW